MMYDCLSKEDIKCIKNNMNDLDSLLYVIDCITSEMCGAAYDEGYDQGYLDKENE